MRVIAPLLALVALASGAESMAPAALVGARLADPALEECSGVVASRVHAGVLWVHNDSGNPAEIFAIDADGTTLARYAVAAANVDWEDIAIADDGLYLADIGNNRRDRVAVRVLRLDEPDPSRGSADPLPVRATWSLSWPGRPQDSEALIIAGRVGYLIDKGLDAPPGLWRFQLDQEEAQVLERVASLPISAPVTGADLSADGRRFAVCHPLGLHVFALPAGDLAATIGAAPRDYLGWLDPRQEACCLVPGGVVAISETRAVRWCSDQRLSGARSAPIVIDLPSAPAAHVLDGELGEWRDRHALAVAEAADAHFRAWAAWRPDGIIVAGEASGSSAPAAGIPGALAEFCIGVERAERTPEYGSEDKRCQVIVAERGRLGLRWPRGDAPPAARVSGALTADGYRFELFLPGSSPLSAERVVRFAATFRGFQARPSRSLPAVPAALWMTPLNWAVARLVP